MLDEALQGNAATSPEEIAFRIELVIRGVHVNVVGDPAVSFPGADGIAVKFRQPTDVEVAAAAAGDGEELSRNLDCIAEATMTCAPPKRAREALQAGEADPKEQDGHEFYEEDALPAHLKEFLFGVRRKLWNAIGATYKILRWRHALPGGAAPFSAHAFQWFDGTHWRWLPFVESWSFELDLTEFRFSTGSALEATTFLERGADEPVAHELWREAWTQRRENPRSALVIGMSAAEVGVKDFLAKRVPEAAWLVIEAPTPDLLKILTTYLPTLIDPAIHRLQFRKGREPKSRDYADPVLRDLQNGQTLRNRTAHRPDDAPRVNVVDQVLSLPRFRRQFLYAASLFDSDLNSNSIGLT
jgi:hypothetical protein